MKDKKDVSWDLEGVHQMVEDVFKKVFDEYSQLSSNNSETEKKKKPSDSVSVTEANKRLEEAAKKAKVPQDSGIILPKER